MFYRGVSEEVTTTTASSNIDDSIDLNASNNTNNMNDDEKHIGINEFNNTAINIQSIGKDLIKQEPSEKHLYKFGYTNSQQNITLPNALAVSNGGGSTISSSSSSVSNSTSTSPSASSSTSSTSATNRKYSYQQEHTQQPSAKRKTTDHHHAHHHHSHHKNINSHSSSSQQVYHQKPVYSEFVSSKCILFIYYKGDLSYVIDDHFKKSMTLSANKSSASISPTSLSSTTNSPSSKSTSKSHLNKTKASNANNWNKTNITNGSYVNNNQPTNFENWSFYNQQSQHQQQLLLQHQNPSSISLNADQNGISDANLLTSNETTSSPNGTFVNNNYDSCWNRTTADVAATIYSNHAHYHYANNNSSYFNDGNNLSNTSNTALLPLPVDLNMVSNISGTSSPTLLASNFKNNLNDTTRTNSINSSTTNKLSPKTLTNIKEESQIGGYNNFDNTNGSFLNAVAASINPYAFHNSQSQQDLLNSYTIPTPNSSSSPQSQQSFSGTNVDSNLFCDYSSGSSPSSSTSNVAKVAASLSYASAISAAAAAVANSSNNASPHYHRYPQYLNNQIDCRRSSNPHYSSHLASQLQYPGFDLNNVHSDGINTTPFKESTSNSNQAYATPIWY